MRDYGSERLVDYLHCQIHSGYNSELGFWTSLPFIFGKWKKWSPESKVICKLLPGERRVEEGSLELFSLAKEWILFMIRSSSAQIECSVPLLILYISFTRILLQSVIYSCWSAYRTPPLKKKKSSQVPFMDRKAPLHSTSNFLFS